MKKILLILCIVSVIFIAGCKSLISCPALAKICPDGSSVGMSGPNCEFAACPSNNTQIANPASVNCINKGGSLKIVDGSGGQYGLCTLPDGKQCEEWSYFRGECPSNCSECRVYEPPSPDFCKEGKIVSGGVDACGCSLPLKCEQVACTADAMMCPDGSYVGRVAPNCDFAPCPRSDEIIIGDKHYCRPVDRKAEACMTLYDPVCGWFSQDIKCIKYPCAITAGNSCEACINPNVEYWTEGECPK